MNIYDFDEQSLEQYLRDENDAYRSGTPMISDIEYDQCMTEAALLYPKNEWFNQLMVEPDSIEGKTVTLPERMLSTNKAYTHKEIEKWADDVVNVGESLGQHASEILFKVTPKLDGYASYLDNHKLYTRGDGRNGTDISRAFSRGLQSVLKFDRAAQGPGEIVVNKQYFINHLSNYYENSRNIIASVIKEGELDDTIKEAIDDGMVVFYPFSELSAWIGNRGDLMLKLEELWELFNDYDYDTDGLVIEATSKDIKSQMGSTNHHHKWQIAFKKNTEYHDIAVTGLIWQTSKNGRLTPVVQLEPTKVSGVTISKATGHHYGNVKAGMIDEGAVVRVCRSGLVIPYIESVINPAIQFHTPNVCPSCNSLTEVDGDNLICTNTETCPAQIEGRIEYFFKTLGNCDGFGPKVVEKICNYGSKTITSIYLSLCRLDFIDMGFGEKTIDNLTDELDASRKRPIEDWRFLASFSIHNVGKGGCEKLLQHHRLADVFNLSIAEIIDIDGFADITATSLVKSLAKIKTDFDLLMELGFNLIETPLITDSAKLTPISGLTIVFTGSMVHGKRDDMEKQAKSLGAKVSSSVSSKTDYLVCGNNVGDAKTKSAEKNGVKVLSEDQYLALLK